MLEFTKIPTVLTADELIDKAFRRGSKISSSSMGTGKKQEERMRLAEEARLRQAQNALASTLSKYVRKFPSFNSIHPFYSELAALLVDMDRTRKSLGAVDWAHKRINEIGNEAVKEIRGSFNNNEFVLATRKQAYGRMNSVVQQIDKDLKHLNAVREELRRLPTVNVEIPTIVVAGYPNVGKSSLIRTVSTAEPEVANYPFTTKGVIIGHFRYGRADMPYQIIDTPGLLDRAFDDRNGIEKQAILALKHLADVIIFILDPSEFCGYTMKEQENLLAAAKATFPNVTFLEVENKVDLPSSQPATPGRFRMSTMTQEGIPELLAEAVRVVNDVSRRKRAMTLAQAAGPAPAGVRRVPSRAERDALARAAARDEAELNGEPAEDADEEDL